MLNDNSPKNKKVLLVICNESPMAFSCDKFFSLITIENSDKIKYLRTSAIASASVEASVFKKPNRLTQIDFR